MKGKEAKPKIERTKPGAGTASIINIRFTDRFSLSESNLIVFSTSATLVEKTGIKSVK